MVKHPWPLLETSPSDFHRLSIYLSAMSADVDDHGSPNISVLCTLYDFILCPRLLHFHSSFHASNITLSLSAPCSFPFKLPCADQIFLFLFSAYMTKK